MKDNIRKLFWNRFNRTSALLLIIVMTLQLVSPSRINFTSSYSFGAGSLIIPMDTTYQNYGMWKAYGLLYRLLANGVPVSWAISNDKTFGWPDFQASSTDLRTRAVVTNHNYSGGPFVIDANYRTQAEAIIRAWWASNANQPSVHVATAGFNANVDIVLRSPPRIANEETNAGIAITYYNAAGIPDLNGLPWSSLSPNILSQEEIADGGLFSSGDCSRRAFDVFVTPHNGGYDYSLTDPLDLGTRTYQQLDYFVHQGGGWVALCHSILSNENAISDLYNNSNPAVRELFKAPLGGGFLTKTGFSIDPENGDGLWTVSEPNLPVAQAVPTAGNVIQGLPGGSVQTWNRSSVIYHDQTELVAHFLDTDGTIWDWGINGVAHDGSTLGKVTFLGGHSYATSLPYSSNMEAPYLKFFYNSLFFNGSAVAKLDLEVSPQAIPQGRSSLVTISLRNVGSSVALSEPLVEPAQAAGFMELMGMDSLNIEGQVTLPTEETIMTEPEAPLDVGSGTTSETTLDPSTDSITPPTELDPMTDATSEPTSEPATEPITVPTSETTTSEPTITESTIEQITAEPAPSDPGLSDPVIETTPESTVEESIPLTPETTSPDSASPALTDAVPSDSTTVETPAEPSQETTTEPTVESLETVIMSAPMETTSELSAETTTLTTTTDSAIQPESELNAAPGDQLAAPAALNEVPIQTQVVTITLAPGVNYVRTLDGYGEPLLVTIDPEGRTILEWGDSLGDITGMATAIEIEVEITPTVAGVKKIAHLEATYGDVYGEAFTADLCRDIEIYPAPSALITKTPDTQSIYPGQVATWSLTYSNPGNATLLGAYVEDILPVGFIFKESTPNPQSVTKLPDGTTRVRWNVGDLLKNANPGVILLKSFVSKDTGTYINQAALKGTDHMGVLYESMDTAEVIVKSPPINLNKTVSPEGPVDITSPGQILTYTLTPSYYGDKLLENVLISDPIPAYTSYVTSSINAGGNYGFTPLPKVDGVDLDTFPTKSTTIAITTAPTQVLVGGSVTVTMTITNNSGVIISNIKPYVSEFLSGAVISQPSTTGFNLANGASSTVTFTATMTEIGGRLLTGGAIGTTTTPDDYTFTEASSNTVLVLTHLNSTPANDVVTWRLGKNDPGVTGENIVSGRPAGIFAFRGGNTKEFSKYTMSSGTWATKAQPTNGIEKGGSLTIDYAAATIYASEGNSKIFYKYDITNNTWTRLADVSNNFNEGGATQFLEVGGIKYVYAILGNSNLFRRYSISSNTWSSLSNLPGTVKGGGALTTDGTNLFALQGDRKTGFYKFTVSTGTWSTLAPTPGNVGWGGALTRIGNYIYAFQGDGKTGFWRYDISANTWTAMANAPGAVADGGSLTNDGTNIFALQGKTKTFWSYDVAANTWTAAAPVNFTGSVGQGGALVYDAGVTPVGQFTSMSTDAGLVTEGQSIKVTMTIRSSTAKTDVMVPTDLTVTGTNSATASRTAGPVLKSLDDDIVDINDPVVYEWTYLADAGTLPGNLVFSTTPTGFTANTLAKSRSVIVTPPLTYQVRIQDAATLPMTVEQITNISMISDRSALGFGIDSNATVNPLRRPKLVLLKSNDPTGHVDPGEIITYRLFLTNEGNGDANNVVISDLIPNYTNYINGSATFEVVPDVPDRNPTITPPSGTARVVFELDVLKPGESVEVSFKVKVEESLLSGSYVIRNFGTADADGTNPVNSNIVTNDLEVTAAFSVLKTPSLSIVKTIGEIITYDIAVINTGNLALTNIVVNDPMLADLEYVPGEDANYNNGDMNTNGILDVGEIWYYAGTYEVTEADIDQDQKTTLLSNTVTVSTNQAGTQTATAEVTLDIPPQLTLVKTNTPEGTVRPGDTITYTLVLGNTSIGTAWDVVVTDYIPAYTILVPGSMTITDAPDDPTRVMTAAEPVNPGDPLSYHINHLKKNETVTMTFQVTTDDTLPAGVYDIANNAVATADHADPVQSNTVHNTLRFITLLKVTKVVLPEAGSGYSSILDGNTTFTIRLRDMETGFDFTTDLVLIDGQTITLEVPSGVYEVKEIMVPAEYQLNAMEAWSFVDNALSQLVWDGSLLEITAEEVRIQVTNRFSHTDYFHNSDSVTNKIQ